MNAYQLHAPKRRRHISATIFGAAMLALAVSGLVQPAVSQADRSWDIGVYDDCIQSGMTIQTCCVLSDGDYDPEARTCYAPPATAQTWPTPLPNRVSARPGKAALP